MMNANNTYFENLKRIGHEWEAARTERQSRKQRIIDTLGWDSDELKAWYEEDAAAKFPFESGVSKAYRAWAQSLSRKEDELEMDDFLWDKTRRSKTSSKPSAAPGSRPSCTPTRARR